MGKLTRAAYDALPEILTPEQAAAVLDTTVTTLYRLVSSGDVPATKIGRTYRFSKTRLESLVQ